MTRSTFQKLFGQLNLVHNKSFMTHVPIAVGKWLK